MTALDSSYRGRRGAGRAGWRAAADDGAGAPAHGAPPSAAR